MDREMEKCSSFEGCEAPLCPMSETLSDCIWYPDEEICHRRGMPKWVRTQRKIVKRIGSSNEIGFFDVSRIEKIQKIILSILLSCPIIAKLLPFLPVIGH